MQFLSVALSITGLLAFVVSFLLKGANMRNILICNSLGNLLMALSYVCILNFNGALSSFVGMFVGIVNSIFAIKQKKIPTWVLAIYVIVFIAVNVAAFTSWVDIFAIAAVLAAVLSVCASTGKFYRIWSLANDVLWTIFDILRGSYGPLLTHGTLIGFTVAGIILHDTKKKNN